MPTVALITMFFDKVKQALVVVRHEDCDYTKEELDEKMDMYCKMHTSLGACFSLL